MHDHKVYSAALGTVEVNDRVRVKRKPKMCYWCGGEYPPYGFSRHFKSERHQKALLDKFERVPTQKPHGNTGRVKKKIEPHRAPASSFVVPLDLKPAKSREDRSVKPSAHRTTLMQLMVEEVSHIQVLRVLCKHLTLDEALAVLDYEGIRFPNA